MHKQDSIQVINDFKGYRKVVNEVSLVHKHGEQNQVHPMSLLRSDIAQLSLNIPSMTWMVWWKYKKVSELIMALKSADKR